MISLESIILREGASYESPVLMSMNGVQSFDWERLSLLDQRIYILFRVKELYQEFQLHNPDYSGNVWAFGVYRLPSGGQVNPRGFQIAEAKP